MSTRATAIVYTGGRFHTSDAKTAHGLVRGPCRYDVRALVDAESAGRDAGVVLDGRSRGIPCFSTFDACLATLATPPKYCVIGVATSGGVLPDEMKRALLPLVQRGIGVVNGLHEFLSDDPAFVAAARASGAELLDVRKPKPRRELHFWSGAIREVRAPRIPVLGTDCALGKRTTCHVIADALKADGVRAAIIATGQTGWLQGIDHGFVLDSTPNDFVSGELEHAIVRCDRDLAPDVILIEGQSALRNPSGPCGAELLLSAESRAAILQHAPARTFFEDQEHLGNRIPSLTSELALIGMYGARVLGLALNQEHLAEADFEPARAAVERETKLPAVYPLREGAARLVPAIRAHLEAERAR